MQVLGYGWAGILKKYVIEPAEMWWPSSLVQVSLFRYIFLQQNEKLVPFHYWVNIFMTSLFSNKSPFSILGIKIVGMSFVAKTNIGICTHSHPSLLCYYL